jgi:hypothetical protein
MFVRSWRLLPLLVVGAFAACSSDSTSAPPGLDIGQSLKVTGAQDVTLEGGGSGAGYWVVLTNNGTSAGSQQSYTLVGNGISSSAAELLPTGTAALSLSPFGNGSADARVRDEHFEARLRSVERSVLTPKIAGARAWRAALQAPTTSSSSAGSFTLARRSQAVPAGVQVGDIVTLNVNGDDACSNPVMHGAVVKAIGTHSIVVADTNNPAGGFSDADFQRYATRFDTLVWPVDVGAFGAPSDIDANGKVVLVFTEAVNELTPANSSSFVGGFTFARDLFPAASTTTRLPSCATSNEGEYFYVMAADPTGAVNGNKFTVGYVDTVTTAIIAHEFQHLINSSRRIYVNNANDLEDTWLDEGLAHIAEELLFYREAGIGPKNNLSTPDIRAAEQRRTAFNLDMVGNAGRYRLYLQAPATSSPYADNDSLSTRGAAWNLLRYLADQKSANGDQAFFQLVNSTLSGIPNLQSVFGTDVTLAIRDWNVSHAVDDVAQVTAELTQPSWNWHSLFPVLYSTYPLKYQVMADGASYSGTVTAGGAAYYKVSVPSGGSAKVTLGGQSSSAGSHMQLVVVRTQ